MKETRENKNNSPARPLSAKGVAALALSAMLMAGVASCKKDKDATPSPTGTLCFRATVEAHSSNDKTYLGGDGKHVIWSEDDKVAVYNKDGKLGLLTAIHISDGTDGSSSADLTDLNGEFVFAGPYRAVYPCPEPQQDVISENDPIPMVLHPNGIQEYSPNGFPKDVNPMAAYGADGATTLSFKNLCGLLKVSLKGNFAVNKIKITSEKQEDILWGNCDITVSSSSEHSISVSNDDNNNKYILTMECNNTQLDEDDATNFYFVLPPNTLGSGFTMEVIDKSGLVAGRLKVTKTTTILASNITSMSEATLTQGDDISMKTGSRHTANCYIATERNHQYMFPCNVKGNGYFELPGGTPCLSVLSDEQKSPELKGYKSASLVWQTHNDGTANPTGVVKDVMLVGDYVHFRTGGELGNALIAVKDANDKILWSWHIWCLNGEPAVATTLNGRSLMDRNLGALSTAPGDAKTGGLMYQWGRKDPFLGMADFSGAGMNNVATLDNKAVGEAGTNPGGRLQYAIENPKTFITSDADPYDWFADPTAAPTTKDGGHPSDGLWATTKTMYDPCPYGWRVVEIGESTSNEITNPTWGTFASEGGNWGSFENSGRMFTDLNGGESFYPASGCRHRDGGVLSNVGSSGYSWSCSPYSTTPLRAYNLVFNSSGVYPSNFNYRANGFPVRPVQESSSSLK